MRQLKKKFLIQVPNDIQIYYHSNKTSMSFRTLLRKKKLKLELYLMFLKDKNGNSYIYVTSKNLNSRSDFSNINLRTATVSKIKKIFIQLLNNICIKLKLVGVGYKVSKTKTSNILHFKLGYSHDIYFKYPSYFKINILKGNIIYISGSSLENISSFASVIRSYKLPEPYKGKGILYLNEKIKLKLGKKV
jgi:ribosomal protein L6P/L9E